MKDGALTTCPKDKCAKARWGRGKVTRQLGTGAGLIFKGSGFYITDYRSEGYKAAAKKESDSKPSATPASGPTPAPQADSGSKATPKATAPTTTTTTSSSSKPSTKPSTKPASGS